MMVWLIVISSVAIYIVAGITCFRALYMHELKIQYNRLLDSHIRSYIQQYDKKPDAETLLGFKERALRSGHYTIDSFIYVFGAIFWPITAIGALANYLWGKIENSRIFISSMEREIDAERARLDALKAGEKFGLEIEQYKKLLEE